MKKSTVCPAVPDSEISLSEENIRDDTARLACLNRNYALNVRILKSEKDISQCMQGAMHTPGRPQEQYACMHMFVQQQTLLYLLYMQQFTPTNNMKGGCASASALQCSIFD